MERHKIYMVLFSAICNRGHRFTYNAFTDFEYGKRTARTPIPDDFAYVAALDDPVFHELGILVGDNLKGKGLKEWQITDCFDLVLPWACDPAPSGHRYSFDGTHWCPTCGSIEIDSYESDPRVEELVEIYHVSHENWKRLSEAEKRRVVRRALRETGCLKD